MGPHPLAGAAQPINAQLDHVAGAQVHRGLLAQAHAGGGAGREHIARQQRHELADVGNEVGHRENQVGRGAVLAQLAVHRQPKAQLAGVGQLIRRGQKRAEGRKGVAALALVPGTAAFELEFALRHVVVQHVAGDVIRRFGLGYVGSAPADDHGQLYFPVGFHRVAGQHNVVVGARQRRGCFQKDNGLSRQFGAHLVGVVGVVQPDAHYFGRPNHGRTQPRSRIYGGQAASLSPHEFGQPAQPVSSKKGFGVVLTERRDVEALAAVQHAGGFLAGRAVAKEFHGAKKGSGGVQGGRAGVNQRVIRKAAGPKRTGRPRPYLPRTTIVPVPSAGWPSRPRPSAAAW